MVSRNSIVILVLVVAFIALAGVAFASPSGTATVPDASAYVLAPLGFAAALAFERRRRRLAKIKHGVGIAYFIVKRAFDVLIAAAVLTLAAPAFALIALLVRIDSPGPILFKRRAIGKNGLEFDMYKFRSMVEGAEQILEQDPELRKAYYVNCKLQSDPRVTRLGRFLRKTSLDELPQLLNILIGNMTFVGPRPIAADEVEKYGPALEQFKTVTPGVTGLWQTQGRSETSYEMRVQMDLAYIKTRSIKLDLYIILCTVPAVLLKRGAF